MTTEQSSPEPTREAPGEQATREALARFVAPQTLDVIDSTNRYLVDLARQGAPEGTAVLAGRQTAGRGRLGRRWVDAAGASVLCSVLFRPEASVLGIDRWQQLTWIVALAGADACTDAGGVDIQSVEVRCKWPNDLVIGERKVAGVLAEVAVPPASASRPASASSHRAAAAPESRSSPAVVVGIGINCNWPADWPPADDPEAAAIAQRAISLDRAAGQVVDRDAVAERLLAQIANRYGRLVAGGGAALTSEYRRKSATIGREVRIELVDETFVGRALDVDDGGRLLVDVGVCTRVVEVGDVVHLR
jgi:BirA family biotin operon repressor/biotin-[acetyl-CoA-carboxylase] ligase